MPCGVDWETGDQAGGRSRAGNGVVFGGEVQIFAGEVASVSGQTQAEEKRYSNSDGHLCEAMKCNLPGGSLPRHHQNNRQGDASETISGPIRADRNANQSQKKYADTEDEHLRSEEISDNRSYYRSKGCSNETLPGNGKGGTER